MAALDESEVKTLHDLSERIVRALDVLERQDWYAARLILADLWQELEYILTAENTAPDGTPPPMLSPSERAKLRRQGAELACALRERSQTESQEMAKRIEDILSE